MGPGNEDLEAAVEDATLEHLDPVCPAAAFLVVQEVHALVLDLLGVKEVVEVELQAVRDPLAAVGEGDQDLDAGHPGPPVSQGAVSPVQLNQLGIVCVAYGGVHVDDRRRPHVDGVTGLVGTDKDVGVLVVVHVQPARD